MIYGRVVERVIISRENLEEIFDVRRRFASRKAGIGYVSPFRNRASGSGFGNRSIRQTIGRFRAFLSFFRRFLDSSGFRETGRNRGSRGEAGKKWRRCLRTRLSVRSDFIAGNERILGESPDSVTRLTGNSSGFYEYGVTVPLIITVWLHPGLKATLKIVIREFFLRASNFTAIFSSLFLPFCPSIFFLILLYRFLDTVRRKGWGKKRKSRVLFLFSPSGKLPDPKSEADSSTEWMKEAYTHRGSKLALEDIVRGAKHHHVSVVVAEAEYPEGGEVSPSRSNRDRFFVKHVVGSSFRRGQRFALSHLRHQWYTLVSSLPLYYRPVLYIS